MEAAQEAHGDRHGEALPQQRGQALERLEQVQAQPALHGEGVLRLRTQQQPQELRPGRRVPSAWLRLEAKPRRLVRRRSPVYFTSP